MCDEISPAMDDLVRGATGSQPVDRFESVRDFLTYLDLVEEELTRPDQDEIPDLLTAAKGTMMADGWQVGQILGKGSTARALLMTRDDASRVYKVALSDAGRTRLAHEAAQLKNLRDSHIVRFIDGPKDIGDRTVLILERGGEQTLGQYLRREGRLAIGDLETLGDHLFQAVGYLEGEGIWHRDIKPDNLAIRELNKKGRRLVLFDFSLADTANRATEAGTQHYLDPFLGTDRRPEYDAAAERYAVAVTLHEMASGELPSWGDGMVEARLLDPSEQLPQLAEDSFDPQLRDRLVAFFGTALQRDPARRYASLKDMSRAWSDVFRALDERRPATTPETVGALPAAPADARQVSAARVAASTPLVAAGLSARALSAAEQQLDVSTVGELIKIPAARVQRLRGVGRGPRNELLKRAREWRQQLQVTEQLPDPAWPAARRQHGRAQAGRRARQNATGRQPARPAPGRAADAVAADPTTLSLDEITGQLVPRDNGKNAAEIRVIRLLLALPDAEGRPSPVPAWAPQAAVAAETGLSQPYVGSLLGKARERWTKSVKPVTELRNTVLEILARRGRVMEAGQLAAALLAERGSGLDDPAARLALAQACLRAAIEAEEHLDNPRLGRRRAGTRLLIAAVATAADDPTTPTDDPAAPTEEELLDYAIGLGRRADELVDLGDASPLPGTSAVLEALAEVTRPDGMPPLSDTDLVSLAAGASQDAAMTARLELYPRSLDPKKALRLAQAASYLGEPGLEPDRLRDRVLARFPELANLPDPGQLRKLLREMGHTVNVVPGPDGSIRYVIPGGTLAGSWSSTRGPTSMAGHAEASAIAETRQRLLAAAEHGGFLAITTKLAETAPVRDELTALADVSPVNVTEVFLATLREIVRERGKPRWESVLAADAADATPAAQAGFGRLLDAVWERLDKQVRAMPGTVMLHDATPLARYAGGIAAPVPAGGRRAPGRRGAARPVAALPHGRPAQARPAGRADRSHPRGERADRGPPRQPGQHHEESLMIDHAALLADLKGQVRVLEDDLRARSADVPEFAAALRDEWQKAHDAERIAAGYEQWLDGEITQAAVGWILGTVFLRFCEDNELIELPYLAGPGERLAIAAERQQAFFEQNPAKTDRDWIIAGFDALADASPGSSRAVRPGTQPDVADHPVARRRQGPAGLLAHPRRGRELPGRARLRGPGLEHPLPRRPLPGPVRIREEDLRAAADPGVRRGVHPRPDAHASDRRVRPGTRPPARPPRPAPPPPRDRPHLRVRPLPARRFRAPPREMGRTTSNNGSLGADPQRPRRPARRRQKPIRRLDRPLPPPHRRHESRPRQAPHRRPRLPPQHRRSRLPPPRPRRPRQARRTLRHRRDPHLPAPRTSTTTSGPSTSWARTPTTSSSATRPTSRSRTSRRTRTTAGPTARSAPASTPSPSPSPIASSSSPSRRRRSPRRRLRRPDHRELLHETRVRQEADRRVLRAEE